MILLGELSLWVSLLMAIWMMTVSYAGGATRRGELVMSGERATYATLFFILMASAGLWTALFTHDFSLKFVASYTSANLPKVYLFSAFWAGQSGSLLFWALILAIFSAIAVVANREKNRELMPWVTGTLGVILVFFILTILLAANPYDRMEWVPPDGRGMNPQLQNPGMAIHPPMLYLGWVGTAIPFAFAIGALVTRRLDTEWLAAIRRWSLISWFFLTIGLVLGMWWAYVELGWGGYWAWDPVENAPLTSWLCQTAFLHSIMIQEKRGMLRKWNVTLVIGAFLLSILGTFLTRSGVIESVHSFAQSPIGNYFSTFLIFIFVVTTILVMTRLKDMEAKAELESMVSREAAFLYNNLVLVGIAFSVLWGTLFPIISEAVRGTKITVGPPFFNSVNVPLGLGLLALTGIGPLIAWRRASIENVRRQFIFPVAAGLVTGGVLIALGMRALYPIIAYILVGFVVGTITQEFFKGTRARMRMYAENVLVASLRLVGNNRRRYGGYIVHLGVAMIFAAFAGFAFKKEFDISLKTGEVFKATDPFGHAWTFTSQGVSEFKRLNRYVTAVAFSVTRDGKPMPVLSSEKRQHVDSNDQPTFEPSTEVGLYETTMQDVYMVFSGMIGPDQAEVRLAFNPLVWWVWYGGMVMAIGGLIVMWPQAEKKRQGGYVTVLRPGSEAQVPVGAGAS